MSIRPAQPESDLPGIVAVINAVEEVAPVSSARVQQWFDHMPPGRTARRMVATDKDDQVIGYSEAVHEPWLPEGQFNVWVGVVPQWRGQGFGFALYEDMEAFLHGQGARQLKSEVRDDDPVSLRFAERNGFVPDRHLFASTLDLEHSMRSPMAILSLHWRPRGFAFSRWPMFRTAQGLAASCMS